MEGSPALGDPTANDVRGRPTPQACGKRRLTTGPPSHGADRLVPQITGQMDALIEHFILVHAIVPPDTGTPNVSDEFPSQLRRSVSSSRSQPSVPPSSPATEARPTLPRSVL